MSNDRQLDRLLAEWATSDAVGAGDDAAVERMVLHGQTIASAGQPHAPRRGWLRLVGGGAIAASLLAALVSVTVLRQQPTQKAAQESQVATATTADAGDEAALESFALLHVPTDEEEEAMI